ncbi:MAG TPA: DUF3048 domain-containing protein, partial [Roseiflexaceae bacterium]|nr:DUF3048 domain-containing protein [Roseiflexaceae bacterium]
RITSRPYAVMLDNHPNAYPQSGMQKAAVVYEALAEYGITRYMVVFVPGITEEVPNLGPVRSARLYYVQWAMGYQALYAHAGGSPQALDTLAKTKQVVNVDALLRSGGAYFGRSKKRSAPHNLYTSTADLAKAAAKFGASELDGGSIGYLFKSESPGVGGDAATSLSYYFLYKQDPAGWVYDAGTNSYLRTRRGKSGIDAASGERLRTNNVVVIEVKERKIANDPKGRIEQDVVGSGVGRLFIDGVQREVTWRKDSTTTQLRFFNPDGSEVAFNPGQIWITVVPSIKNLTVK